MGKANRNCIADCTTPGLVKYYSTYVIQLVQNKSAKVINVSREFC